MFTFVSLSVFWYQKRLKHVWAIFNRPSCRYQAEFKSAGMANFVLSLNPVTFGTLEIDFPKPFIQRSKFRQTFARKGGIIFQPRPHFDSVIGPVSRKRARSERKCRLRARKGSGHSSSSYPVIVVVMRIRVKAHLEFFWQFCFEANFSAPKGASAVQ